jgi:hypothetical protein
MRRSGHDDDDNGDANGDGDDDDQQQQQQHRLRVTPDPFFNSWHCYDDLQLAPRLLEQLSPPQASLVLFKGDANYRRLFRDHWRSNSDGFASMLAHTASGLEGASIVCLRTCKSDTQVGVAPATVALLDAADAAWRRNGQRGVIQSRLVERGQ